MSINKEKRKVEDTFEKLVMSHYQRIFNYIHMFTNNYELSKDLTQDTFTKAYVSFKRLKKKSAFPLWIMRIARNLSINRMRKEHLKRTRFISLFTKKYKGELQDFLSDPSSPLLENAERQEEKNIVRQALYEIPQRMREALILKEWENLSYEEIGKVMKTSRKAVKSLIHRARETIRKKLVKKDAFR